ncbi:MAG TPA: dienelactone hydrolase family protein [Gemmatimonadales bacterium]|nr:dienelactone hydrolase family protein [Gemmatimonadales bacterium]
MTDLRTLSAPGPHGGRPVLAGGVALADARRVLLAVHGRGAEAESMLELAHAVASAGWAHLAPQAAGHTWYPYSFLEPMERNEPNLSSALTALDNLVLGLGAAGFATEQIALMGFSQGACLTLEYVARHPRRYAAVFGLSGGLIGPPGTPRDYAGSLAGTPVFLGCSDVDAHIPVGRVHETAETLRRMGAEVDERIYPGMGHTVNSDEMAAMRERLSK